MWETGSRANFADWREYDAVAVWELAALMAGIDQRALSDVVGPDGDALDLSAEQEAVIAGAHAGAIECGQFEQPPITPKTIIKMASAIVWLRQHNRAPVATALDRTLHTPTPDRIIKKEKLIERYADRDWSTIEEDLTGFVGAADSPLLGVHEGRAIYLLYNGIPKDKSVAGGNVLSGVVFDMLPPFAGPKVIYAAACRLGGAHLAREGITFKQTPYALEV